MQKALLIAITLLGFLTARSQSTDDIRFTYGEGPYPFYITSSLGFAGTKCLFEDFVTDYIQEKGGRSRGTLYAWELNAGVVINSQHTFVIKNFRIKGAAAEIGYMSAFRRINIEPNHKLHLVESTGSFRLIWRYAHFYPLTFQAHAGLQYYNFYQVRDVLKTDTSSVALRLRAGTGVNERTRSGFSGLFPGYDLRVRIVLFDPTGVGSGVGAFFEYAYQRKWKKDNLKGVYDLVGLSERTVRDIRRNVGRFSVGLVAPIAIKMY